MISYNDMINKLKTSYPMFDITMGTGNELRAPAIVIQLLDIDTSYANDDVYGVVGATYNVLFYVDSSAHFDPWPASHLFGNLTQVNFDRLVDGELFQSTIHIIGTKALWSVGGD